MNAAGARAIVLFGLLLAVAGCSTDPYAGHGYYAGGYHGGYHYSAYYADRWYRPWPRSHVVYHHYYPRRYHRPHAHRVTHVRPTAVVVDRKVVAPPRVVVQQRVVQQQRRAPHREHRAQRPTRDEAARARHFRRHAQETERRWPPARSAAPHRHGARDGRWTRTR